MIGVGLAAFGMSGKVFHAPALSKHPGFCIKKVVERSKREVESLYPGVQSVPTWEEVLADPSIELVVVNTPDPTHFALALQALEAGKHVLVEKPATETCQEWLHLMEVAKQKKRLLTVFQNRRWDGDFLTIKQLLQEGILGRTVSFSSFYQRYRPQLTGAAWKEQVSWGKGITFNLGSHMVDQALQLFGKPEGVYADIDRLRDVGAVDDYYHIQLLYPKLKVELKASYLVREEIPRYSIHGTKGSFIKYGIDPQEEELKKGVEAYGSGWGEEDQSLWAWVHSEREGKEYKERIPTLAGNYLEFYQALYTALREGGALPVQPEEVLLCLQVLEAAISSSKEKKVMPI